MERPVRSAAHFVVCECGWHGRVVSVKESKELWVMSVSQEFWTAEEALLYALDAYDMGRVTDDELPELVRQIQKSGLCRDGATLDNLLCPAIEQAIMQFSRRIADEGSAGRGGSGSGQQKPPLFLNSLMAAHLQAENRLRD